MTEPKRMSIEEFRGLGFLQELNRQFLHPLGLALEVLIDEETGDVQLGGVWDFRDDPEGLFFCDLNETEAVKKARRVQELREEKATVRKARYGYVVQPIEGATSD